MMTSLAVAAALISFPYADDLRIGAQQKGGWDDVDIEHISFEDARCFESDVSQFPLVTFYATHPTTLLPYGVSTQTWEITALMGETELTFISGWFEFAFDDGDGDVSTLYGEYLDFDLDMMTSEYTVDWYFEGGTGDLEDTLLGFGRTYGQADLVAGCAEYSFNGLLFLDD